MAIDTVNVPSSYLKEASPGTGKAFREMRDAIEADGPLDKQTRELVMLTGFAVKGFEMPFKIHAVRSLKLGVPKAAIKQAVLLTMGAHIAMFEATRALRWLDEAAAEVEAKG